MNAVALFSGGKDSTYSIYLAMQQGYDIKKLITIYPKERESFMYHIPMIERTALLSEAMGIERDVYRIGDDMASLKNVLKNYDVDAVISGAIASNYQKTKIEEVCTDLGFISYAPLWGKEQKLILKDIISAGFKVIIIGVYAYGLDERHLGLELNDDFLRVLIALEKKYRINVAGEGGEYESFVLDAPFFKKRVVVDSYNKVWNGVRGELVIEKLHLEEK